MHNGRKFLKEFGVIRNQCYHAYNMTDFNTHGGAYGVPLPSDKLSFTIISTTAVDISAKDHSAYAQPYVKSLRAINEDGQWRIDIDPKYLL